MSALSHKGVQLIVGGWTFFIAENLILSENRDFLVGELGETTYRNLYGTLSTAACGSIAVGYLRFGRGQGPVVWRGALSPAAQAGAFGLQALGLVGFSQLAPPVQLPVAFAPPTGLASPHEHPPVGKDAANATLAAAQPLGLKARCPIDFDHSRRQEGKDVAGAKRVTRHPVLWGMALVGLGSALASPLAAEVAFGVMPLAMAVMGGLHQDLRGRRNGTLPPPLDAQTSHLPFAALLTGQQQWGDVAGEFAWSNAAIAVAVAGGLAARRRGAAAKQLLAIAK